MLFLLLEVFPEELSFLSLRQLIDFIISSSVCQELFFILFSSFFRNPVTYHSQQQFIILSELSVHVKQFFIFLNFFSEIRVAFVRRNSHKVYQDCLSMSSTFWTFFRSSCYSRLPQQKNILSAFFCSVNSFLKLFLPGVNARFVYRFSCRHGSRIRKTTNEMEQHRKTPAKSGIATSFLQTFSTMTAIPDILPASCFSGSYFS